MSSQAKLDLADTLDLLVLVGRLDQQASMAGLKPPWAIETVLDQHTTHKIVVGKVNDWASALVASQPEEALEGVDSNLLDRGHKAVADKWAQLEALVPPLL